MFVGLLCFGGPLVFEHRAADHIESVALNNQPCQPRQTLINLNLDELYYYPFVVSVSKCGGSCNTIDDPFGRICVPNKIEDINLKLFNMINGINESKTLSKHVSCECRYKFDGKK